MHTEMNGEPIWHNDRAELLYNPNSSNERTILALAGDINIYSLPAIKRELLSQIQACDILELDLSQVRELDSAGFQLFLSCKAEGQTRGKKIVLTGHSTPVLEMIDMYGAIGLLGDKVTVLKEEKSKFRFQYGLKKQPFYYRAKK